MTRWLLDIRRPIDYAHSVTSATPTAHLQAQPAASGPDVRTLTTGLESCGLAAADTAALLLRLAAGDAYRDVARDIAAGTLLRKKSRKGRQHVLAALRRRYLNPSGPLARPERLAAALRVITIPVARNQLLLPYLLSADRGAHEVIVDWVNLRRTPGGRITTDEVVLRLDEVPGLQCAARGLQLPPLESLRQRAARLSPGSITVLAIDATQ